MNVKNPLRVLLSITAMAQSAVKPVRSRMPHPGLRVGLGLA